ncbi:DUF2461 domain-containing protein [Sphingomonas sp. CLY1604]|uniref:DUF2461 domain-containing protein n=1 Tax=Sphingomonas sp. CLY1604 TaxID=3457786 RepID=UPI003FD82D56
MINDATLRFLKELGNNNDKAWFDTHRDLYEAAKADAVEAAAALIDAATRYDPAIGKANLEPRKCVKRINRDPRFNKGKPPYKTELLIILNAGDPAYLAGYYLHIEPANCRTGGSLLMPSKNALARMRRSIADDPNGWEEIRNEPAFRDAFPKGIFALDALKNVPTDFAPDDPAAAWLKMKGYGIAAKLTHADLTAQDGADTVVDRLATARPLVEFLNRNA